MVELTILKGFFLFRYLNSWKGIEKAYNSYGKACEMSKSNLYLFIFLLIFQVVNKPLQLLVMSVFQAPIRPQMSSEFYIIEYARTNSKYLAYLAIQDFEIFSLILQNPNCACSCASFLFYVKSFLIKCLYFEGKLILIT
jgi:hypothetical protein